jgi:hypothetical protein
VLAHQLLLHFRLHSAVRRFKGDQKLRQRARVEVFIQLGHAANNRLHQRQFGDELGAGLGKGNCEPPGCRRPVKQGDIAPGNALQCAIGIVVERRGEARVMRLQAAHPIPVSADIEPARAVAQGIGAFQALGAGFVDARIHESVGVFGEALGRGEQQAGVLGRFREEALVGLEPEGDGGFHQFGVVVAGESAASRGQRIPEFVDGHTLDRAARRQEQRAAYCCASYEHLHRFIPISCVSAGMASASC